MKRLSLALSILLFVGVGCTVQPVVQPQPYLPTPAPAPDPHGPEAKSDLIVVDSPAPGADVQSPLTVTGKARGTWYFEASFPVRVLDASGAELAIGPAQAQGEWMTTEFVPFKIKLYFKTPPSGTGTLVLQKDNPSGLPEHDDHLSIPIVFKAGAKTSDGCRPTGCSGQVCSDEDVMTTCEFRQEYACYKDADCIRQDDGTCGWTKTDLLTACLKGAVNLE